jgi:hypothetical protein
VDVRDDVLEIGGVDHPQPGSCIPLDASRAAETGRLQQEISILGLRDLGFLG